MQLQDLVNTSTGVSATRSRLNKRALLGDCLRLAAPSDIGLAVRFLSGEMPQGRIGLGPASVSAVRQRVSPGDGTVSLSELSDCFTDIKACSGAGSKKAREDLLGEIMSRVSADEQDFIAGLVVGEVRQGALEALLIDAIADASGIELDAVRRAVMLSADAAAVAEVAFSEGEPGLSQFRLEPLVPVRPMLAQPAETIDEAMDSLGRAVLQTKIDGARIQVHKLGDDVQVFTRQLHNVTTRLPEVIQRIGSLPVDSLILDGEAIAFGKDDRPLPFQVTMRRFGRSSNVDELLTSLPLTDLYFDCLYRDGESLIDRPLEERLRVMAELLPADALVGQTISDDPAVAARFLSNAFEGGHEGAMAKSPTSVYAAGNRGADWLKLKQAHTLDLVVLAAEWGSGRRKGWLSNLHLGARDGDAFVMLGKTFKGLTDKRLKWQTDALLERETHREDHTVFVRPELIVEIAFNDVQASSQYPGGMALRFARVRSYRDDLSLSDVDTIETVRGFLPEVPA